MDRFRIDSHKLIYHPRWVANYVDGHAEWAGARDIPPLYVEISPIGACNHRCTFCAVDYIGYQTRSLAEPALLAALAGMGRTGVRAVMFAGEGEPLLYKGIDAAVAAAAAAGIDVAFTTNGVPITPRFIEASLPKTAWIKVSINAGTAATYAALHRTQERDFDRVFDNLAACVAAKRAHGLPVVIGAQALLLPENAAEMATLARRCRATGLDYLVVKPYSQHRFSHTRIYEGVDYTAFGDLASELAACSEPGGFQVIYRGRTMEKHDERMEARYPRCRATPFAWAYIMADGDVYSCSAYLGDARFVLGNINDADFQAIWTSPARRANHAFVQNDLDIRECRRNCRMDEVNRYLDALVRGTVEHVNFI